MSTSNDVREEVRARYAQAANAVNSGVSNSALNDGLQVIEESCGESSCCSGTTEVDESFGAALYSSGEQSELPAEAVAASLGCGNPTAVAALQPGDCVLDLGSGGGIDVLLSARRVGETGFAYGVDVPDARHAPPRRNAAKATPTNGEVPTGPN